MLEHTAWTQRQIWNLTVKINTMPIDIISKGCIFVFSAAPAPKMQCLHSIQHLARFISGKIPHYRGGSPTFPFSARCTNFVFVLLVHEQHKSFLSCHIQSTYPIILVTVLAKRKIEYFVSFDLNCGWEITHKHIETHTQTQINPNEMQTIRKVLKPVHGSQCQFLAISHE